MLASAFFCRNRDVLFALRFLLQSLCDSSLPEGAIQIAIGGRIWNPPLRKARQNGGRSKPLPYPHLNISTYPNQKQSFHFAVRRNFTPQVFRLPTAANFTRRRRISLCNRREAVAPYASLREGGGPRSGGRSRRVRKQRFALYEVFAFVFLVIRRQARSTLFPSSTLFGFPIPSTNFQFFIFHSSLLFCLPPGGRGTAKRGKKSAGTKAEPKALERADI